MVKKTIINESVYSGYRVNNKEGGLLKDHLDKLIDMVERCYSKGRWNMVHLRYQPAEGVTNSEFLEKLKRVFPDQASLNTVVEGLRYIWVRELGDTKQPLLTGVSGGVEIEGEAHYHAFIFINRHLYKKHFASELHKLRDPEYVTGADSLKPKTRKRKKYLQHFHCPTVDINQTTSKLWEAIDKRNLLSESVSGVELKINSIDAVAYAVYWASYIAKVETKYTKSDGKLVKLVKKGRGFGSSQLDKDWREKEKYYGAKIKIDTLNQARLSRLANTATRPTFPESEIVAEAEAGLFAFDVVSDDAFVTYTHTPFDDSLSEVDSLLF